MVKSMQKRQCGFTLIELMIVISIIFILIGMAVGAYQRSILRAREAALKSDLQTMRQAIDSYTLDKQAAPQSLEDLKNERYLHEVPIDPMTHAKDWVPDYEDVLLSPTQSGSGITDVHSASTATSPFENTPYSQW
jgi:general secretion pathway protein G